MTDVDNGFKWDEIIFTKFIEWYAPIWFQWYGHRNMDPRTDLMLRLYWSRKTRSGSVKKYGSGITEMNRAIEKLVKHPYANTLLRLADQNRITKELYNISGFRLDFDADCPFQAADEVIAFLNGIKLYPSYLMQTGTKSFHCLFLIDWSKTGIKRRRYFKTKEVVPLLNAVDRIIRMVPHADPSADPYEIKVPGTVSKGKFLVKGFPCPSGQLLDVIDWIKWAEEGGLDVRNAVPPEEKGTSFFEEYTQQIKTPPNRLNTEVQQWIQRRQAAAEEVITSFLQETLPRNSRRSWVEPVARHLASKLNFLAEGTERISGQWLGEVLLGGTRQWGEKILSELVCLEVLTVVEERSWTGKLTPNGKPIWQAKAYRWHENFIEVLKDADIKLDGFSNYDEYPRRMSWELASHDIWVALHKGWDDDAIVALINEKLGDTGRQDAVAMVKGSRENFKLPTDQDSGSDSTSAHP